MKKRMKQIWEPSREPETVAYLRVSTRDQDLEKNKYDMFHYTDEMDLGKVIFFEIESGSKLWWEWKLNEVLDCIQLEYVG